MKVKLLDKLINIYKRKGFIYAVEYRIKMIIVKCFRRFLAPSLQELGQNALAIHSSLNTIDLHLFNNQTAISWLMIEAEFQALSEELSKRQASYSSVPAYQPEFVLETSSCMLLYGITRITKPETVLECGVADGYSTFFLLNALRKNRSGQLYSVDVSTDVGSLLTEEEKQTWVLKILDTNRPRHDFKEFIGSLKSIDLYLHDSDHRYTWQLFEYNNIFKTLSSAGIFMSDDIDASYAFRDFCSQHRLKPIVLLEKRKALGVVWRRRP